MFALAALVAAVAPSPEVAATQAQPAAISDGSGAYATGRYRNLFAEAGHASSEIDAKIDDAYQQLFHGDPDTQRLFTQALWQLMVPSSQVFRVLRQAALRDEPAARVREVPGRPAALNGAPVSVSSPLSPPSRWPLTSARGR